MLEENSFTFNLVGGDNDPVYDENNPGSPGYRLTNVNYDKARFTMVVTTQEIEDTIPWDLTLTQNFPNPFGESTTIRFGLSEASDVELAVYDLMGRRIETLQSGSLEPGYHEQVWTPRGVSDGIYLLMLKTGKEMKTFKMTLMR